MENIKSRIWIAAIVGIAAVLAIILTVPRAQYAPKGVLLPAKTTLLKPTAADEVALYDDFPTSYTNLGTIRIERHAESINKIAENQIIAYARQLAAKAGANGVVIKAFYHTPIGGVPKAQAVYEFIGYAIYDKNPKQSL